MSLFTPRVSIRSPSTSYFAELYQSAGPERIGEVGRGTVEELFGWDWLALIDRDGTLRAYQRDDAHPDGWKEIHDELPPIFGQVLPPDVRRLSLTFDQSARAIVAYEQSGIVRVTRWSSDEQQYIQDVSFAGTNPLLTIDAIVGIPMQDTDALLFYQPVDAQHEIRYRVQRQIYGESHLAFSHSEPLILDRAEFLAAQLQLLVSDAEGNPLRGEDGQLAAIASGLYTRTGADAIRSVAVPVRADYRLLVYNNESQDAVRSAAVPLNLPGKNTPIGPVQYAMGSQPGTPLQGGWRTTLRKNVGSGPPACGNSLVDVASGGYLSGPEIDWCSPAYDVADFYGFANVRIDADVTWFMLEDSRSFPAGDTCTLTNYASTNRTIIAEFGIGPTASVADAAHWAEVGRYTGRHSGYGLPPENTRHVFRRDISMLADGRYPYAFVRVRVIAPGSLGGTGVALEGIAQAHVLPLTNAYMGNIVRREPIDAIRATAVPITVEHRSDMTRVQPVDVIHSAATPITVEHRWNVSHTEFADQVRSVAVPIRAESRRTP